MLDDNLIEVENLKKYFPIKRSVLGKKVLEIKAVDGVSISIRKGETLGLVGESGCGKTTLGRCIIKLEDVSEGKLYFESEDISSLKKRKELFRLRRNMQIIFQDPYSSLNPRMTAAQIIGEALDIHNIKTKQERRKRIRELMHIVGLKPAQFNRYPHEFSGGQRQRIGVARALSLNPKFVVADEPVSALDVSIQAQILNLLVDLQNEFDLTYLFISHDLSIVRHLSDKVAVMYLGRIVELAETNELYSHPLHPYTQALLQAIPLPSPERERKPTLLEGDVPSTINIPMGCNFHPRCPYRRSVCSERIPIPNLFENSHYVLCHFPKTQQKQKEV
jgi:oligopeptide/dipeptide ABC transporter ATP-binding protein